MFFLIDKNALSLCFSNEKGVFSVMKLLNIMKILFRIFRDLN